ncbi:MAG: NADH-quinone oxidoreductase subunit L [Candidatus Bathyarchaeota archaeon]|nr:NADH-quinone oxidoreductase subunit L [Candidatus Bathyarchaeota archaeon]
MQLTELSAWLVWILPLVSCLFVPLIAKIGSTARNLYVVAVSAVTAVLAFSLIPVASTGLESYVPWVTQNISAGVFIDPLGVLFACLVSFFGLIIAVYSIGYMKEEQNLTRYNFFLLLFIGSMIGLVVSDNFLQMFIFWEMVGLCSYSLISFWSHRPESVKAGNKVFLMTRIGDVLLLGAIGLLFTELGSFSFRYAIDNIAMIPTPTLTAIAFLILGGAVAKSAQLPLHTWLYSAMEAPTSVSALLHAATMVKAGIYLIARFILIAGPLVATLDLWLPTVAWIGVLTAFLGATLAIHTPDIKGVLAYSTVSQLGFMMAALGTVHSPESLGMFASLFHMMSHAFFEGLGFLLAGGIIHALGTRDMRLMGGLRKLMPVTFVLAVLMIITTSGLPPFAAFFSKGLVIESLMESGNILQLILIFSATAMTFAYSLRFIKLVFLGKESEHIQKLHVHEAPKVMLAPAIVLGALCIIWGFVMPYLGTFLASEAHTSFLGAFLNIETAIFAAILVPAGLLVYATYFKNYSIMTAIRSPNNPVSKLLAHGYFFDDFYEKGVVRGLNAFSSGVKFVEVKALEVFPQAVATSVIRFAGGVHKYLDAAADNVVTAAAGKTESSASKVKAIDSLADRLLDVVGHRTEDSAKKVTKRSSDSLQHYLAAALIGFIMLVILIIISIGV